MKPLRALALVLLLLVGAEIWGIAHTPDYAAELAAAKAGYESALADYRQLKKAASAYAAGWTR